MIYYCFDYIRCVPAENDSNIALSKLMRSVALLIDTCSHLEVNLPPPLKSGSKSQYVVPFYGGKFVVVGSCNMYCEITCRVSMRKKIIAWQYCLTCKYFYMVGM